MTTAKRKTSSINATDYGTPELAKRFTVVPKLTLSNGYTGKVVDDSEIDRLLLNDIIASDEYSLLVALLHRLHRASFVGLKSPDLNGVGHADPRRLAERKANAVMSVCEIIRMMDRMMGSDRRMSLVNLVLLDVPWPHGDAALHHCITTLDAALSSSQPATTSSRMPPRSHAAARDADR